MVDQTDEIGVDMLTVGIYALKYFSIVWRLILRDLAAAVLYPTILYSRPCFLCKWAISNIYLLDTLRRPPWNSKVFQVDNREVNASADERTSKANYEIKKLHPLWVMILKSRSSSNSGKIKESPIFPLVSSIRDRENFG